ncbi:ATP-dependent helicase [Desulfosporosinus fructosivorans]|uniref:ATP-dependent helicase/nuclease subunit A n=1 Tax=Desulfosporosinus fructosivorans TaxID=2018669 RepID=A0A4Z0R256_9FIRM|nr:UvrD-helicase domain-containing protein [Desulfosporosinus fructosivorans]TGE36077.1 ATP-dependent helicase [Desulfosporosinus fructosivorans]
MSKTQWTAEQRAAITLRGQLLVAAAAGSGKTAVLVERLIQRITNPDEPEDVDRFLVVTFTKAAANEMRERIGKALDEALFLAQVPGDVDRLIRQRTLLQRANITTLHSFCLELIRKYFYQLELDPAFRVADQAEADLLRQDVVEELFETRYEGVDLDFLKLVDAFGSDRDDQPLMDHVLRLFTFAYSQPRPDIWLAGLEQAYVWEDIETMMQSDWGQAVRQGLLDLVSGSLNSLERAEEIAQRPGGPALYSETLQDDKNRVQLLKRALIEGDWAQVETQFRSAVNYPRLPAARSKAKKKGAKDSSNPELGADAALEQVSIEESYQKNLQEECKKLRDEAKKKLNSLHDEVFAFPIIDQLPALREMGTMAQTLGTLVSEFSRVYAVAKAQRNVLDFTDLEHFALQLLEEQGEASLIAQKLKDYFAEVLVDEYQDINPVQERILRLVSRQEESPNLFMVGDVKQSIYRFRMADPSLFLEKYSTLQHWHSGMPSSTTPKEIVIDLNRNFRSRLEVVEGVNFLFRQIMTKGAGEIPYDDQAALQFGAAYVSDQNQINTAEGPIEVHLIDLKSIRNQLALDSTDEVQKDLVNLSASEAQDDPEFASTQGATECEDDLISGAEDAIASEDLDKARIEARLVSERIQRLVQGAEFQIHDRKLNNFRPVRYSDIVILMRTYSAVAPIYVEEFQSANIPVYAETTTGYFGASEVETMLSLLKVIDNPRNDIPLAAVLRSPLVGLNGTELGKIRMILPEGDFYEALTLAVWIVHEEENLSPERTKDFQKILGLYEESLKVRLEKARLILATATGIKDKITDFWIKLQTWRTLSRRTSLADLLWTLYEETGYLTYVGTLPAGAQRQANLRVLYDRASRFEATRYRGLFRFLRFLDRFRGQGKDMGNARALGETEDVVRLITVHASKGLEFPVVFMVGLGRTFNTQSLKGKVLLHSKLGMGMPIIDIENNVRYPSLIQYAVKQRLAQEALAEELRILYVALTRAKERLFLYGTMDNLDKTFLKWYRTLEWGEVALPDGQLRSAKCFLDWIGPALARHPRKLFGETEGRSTLAISEINSRWDIQIHRNITADKDKNQETNFGEGKDEGLVMSADNSAESEQIPIDSNSKAKDQLFAEIDRRLSWQYPHLKAVRKVAKTSVSELKRQYNWHADEGTTPLPTLPKNTDSLKRPKFLQEEQKLTAAERGTALHTAMQHLPFEKWATKWRDLSELEQINNVSEFLNMLMQREILSGEQRTSIKPAQIAQFLNSQMGERFFSAEQILREIPFTLTFPSESELVGVSRVDKTNILVQGVIDVVLLSRDEHQEIHAEILDYKTDSFWSSSADKLENSKTDPEEILRERYTLQLSLYALAIERLLKIKISGCTLYSFTLGREIAIADEVRKSSQITGIPLFAK